MKHIICALKGAKTIQDEAELTLYTVERYKEKTNNKFPVIINHRGDAKNIHHFLTEHLPEETLAGLKTLLSLK